MQKHSFYNDAFKKARGLCGWSQEDLALESDLSTITIRRAESESTATISTLSKCVIAFKNYANGKFDLPFESAYDLLQDSASIANLAEQANSNEVSDIPGLMDFLEQYNSELCVDERKILATAVTPMLMQCEASTLMQQHTEDPSGAWHLLATGEIRSILLPRFRYSDDFMFQSDPRVLFSTLDPSHLENPVQYPSYVNHLTSLGLLHKQLSHPGAKGYWQYGELRHLPRRPVIAWLSDMDCEEERVKFVGWFDCFTLRLTTLGGFLLKRCYESGQRAHLEN